MHIDDGFFPQHITLNFLNQGGTVLATYAHIFVCSNKRLTQVQRYANSHYSNNTLH